MTHRFNVLFVKSDSSYISLQIEVRDTADLMRQLQVRAADYQRSSLYCPREIRIIRVFASACADEPFAFEFNVSPAGQVRMVQL